MPDQSSPKSPRKGDRAATRNRVVRVSDEVWEEAKAVAEHNGERVSDVVRRALVEYAGLSSEDGLTGSSRDYRSTASSYRKHDHEHDERAREE